MTHALVHNKVDSSRDPQRPYYNSMGCDVGQAINLSWCELASASHDSFSHVVQDSERLTIVTVYLWLRCLKSFLPPPLPPGELNSMPSHHGYHGKVKTVRHKAHLSIHVNVVVSQRTRSGLFMFFMVGNHNVRFQQRILNSAYNRR